MHASRIAVVGSFMQATCWQVPRLPQPGETLAATVFFSEPAGKGLAVAVGCRRLGAAVDLLLAIGDDLAGDALMRRLSEERLSTQHVVRYDEPSGQGAGWLSAGGDNAIAAYRGANLRLDAKQVASAAEALAQATLVYAQLEAPAEAASEAFAHARQHAAWTVLNPSPWQTIDHDLLARTQVLLVNASEAAELVPGWQPWLQPKAQHASLATTLAPLWKKWPGVMQRRLVVTLGATGSLAFAPDGASLFVPAFPVEARSSIGAGDAFAAGFCVALCQGLSVAEALRHGNACGAVAVGHHGILDGLPDTTARDAMLRFST